MTFDTYELSDHEGSAVELYLFETDDLRQRWAYTSDADIRTVGLYTYLPESISRSELKQTAAEGGSERLTINVPWNNPVAVLHIPYLPPRPVRVTIFRLQRRDAGIEVVQAFVGYISNFAQKGATVDLFCSQIIDTMQQNVPWAVFKSGCLWTTYDAQCGALKFDFRTPVNDLTLIQNDLLRAPSIGAKPDGWFTAGLAENDITGEIRFIIDHVGDQVKLVYPFTGITLATQLSFYAGDDHHPETCRLKFNRKTAYVGFDFFPNYNVFEKGTK